MNSTLHYAFVGAFRERARDGAVGGQLHACRTLMASGITQHVRFSTIDSTMVSVPPPPVRGRVLAAARRTAVFGATVSRPRVDGALIFTSAWPGLLEKSLMALYTRALGKRVILSPRSGLIQDDVARSPRVRQVVRRALASCHRVICQGQSWQRYYRELGGPPDDKYVVVPNWLEVSRHIDQSESRAARRGTVTFLYLGWLEVYKGILDLIRAVALAGDGLADARIVVCGRGHQNEAARQLAEDLGVADRVDFRGWVTGEAKTEVLKEADVLVLPSHREGMPNALLEAMATGLPAIACRVGGVPDVLINDELGVLIEPHDVEALADALTELAHDGERRVRLGRAARAHVEAHHDIAVLWPRILDLLR